ncbi:recombination regulator RecX [Metabacillus halosaccharovorans]|uniref:recombination regulator RecX n=1 Tax=Metabacillus halosaccharovorans TaxID=930124 RepID=UPI001C1FF036|nr:recombination regulator RecX [Metabacillus halosaccharovorans]MBU7594856.1 recombination regulator RecX [Metabacillus halosaccharovorans]
MALITKITTQKQSTERFNIYLDDGQGEKYAFSVDQDVFIKYNLRKGQEIDELEIHEIQYGDLSKKAYNKALEFLSYRMRSIKEVAEHLAKKEFNDVIIQDVIYKLKEYNYVDDLEFAIAYVRTQKQTNGKGPNVLKRELIGKGINQDFIEQALQEYKDDDQLQEAIDHAEKLLKKNNRISTVQIKQKIEQHLMRKGFPYDIISKALDEVQYEQDESEEWTALMKHAEKAQRKYQNEDPYQYRMKMKQFLYRKGFSIELIEKFLEDEE